MVGHACFHCRGYTQRLVYTTEIVMHIVERHSRRMILNLLAESVEVANAA